MYQHLETRVNEGGHAVSGAYDPTKKQFRAFDGTVEELVHRLRDAFEQMAKHTVADAPPPKRPGPRVR